MRVILLCDVKKQGKKDDIITVKDGYGTFLIKNKMAVLETSGSSKVLKDQQASALKKEEELIRKCEKIKRELENKVLKFKVRTGAMDKVFGTISTKQISSKLKELGYDIDKRKIQLDGSINTLGVTNVKIELHKKVIATLSVELCK